MPAEAHQSARIAEGGSEHVEESITMSDLTTYPGPPSLLYLESIPNRVLASRSPAIQEGKGLLTSEDDVRRKNI
jgi:hypothetical protein